MILFDFLRSHMYSELRTLCDGMRVSKYYCYLDLCAKNVFFKIMSVICFTARTSGPIST